MLLRLAPSLVELPEYGGVLGNLIARDLKVKYQSGAVGLLWSLLYPAAMIAIWYAVFHHIINISMPDYWAFLITGMLPFQFLQNAIVAGSSAVRRNAGIVRKVYVPMEILVIAAVTVKLVEFLLQLAVAIVLLLIAHRAGGDGAAISLSKTLIVLPAAVLLLYLFALGVSLPLAGWTVIYRDLEHMVSLALMALLYLTPVFWSVTLIQEQSRRWVFALNPASNLIELFRGPLYWGTFPTNGALGGGAIAAWGVAVIVSFGALLAGHLLFGQTKRVLAEVV